MTEKAAGSLSIRACRLEDIQSSLELWRQADATPGVTDTDDDLRRAIADSPAHVLVAEVGGRLVGSVIGTFDGWRGNIYRLAVHPDHRRQGFARALVAEVEARLTRQGAKRITALVEKDQPRAMALLGCGRLPGGRADRPSCPQPLKRTGPSHSWSMSVTLLNTGW